MFVKVNICKIHCGTFLKLFLSLNFKIIAQFILNDNYYQAL